MVPCTSGPLPCVPLVVGRHPPHRRAALGDEGATGPAEQEAHHGLEVLRRLHGFHPERDPHVEGVQEDVPQRRGLRREPRREEAAVVDDRAVVLEQLARRSGGVGDGERVVRLVEAASGSCDGREVPPCRRPRRQDEVGEDLADRPPAAQRGHLPVRVVEPLKGREQRSTSLDRDRPRVHAETLSTCEVVPPGRSADVVGRLRPSSCTKASEPTGHTDRIRRLLVRCTCEHASRGTLEPVRAPSANSAARCRVHRTIGLGRPKGTVAVITVGGAHRAVLRTRSRRGGCHRVNGDRVVGLEHGPSAGRHGFTATRGACDAGGGRDLGEVQGGCRASVAHPRLAAGVSRPSEEAADGQDSHHRQRQKDASHRASSHHWSQCWPEPTGPPLAGRHVPFASIPHVRRRS